MTWIGIALFLAVGLVLVVWRRPIAHAQAMMFGGRMPPGCAVAEGIVLFVLALLIYLARR